MGTTLTGTTPQDTYDSLIKVTDNGPLTGSLKVLTDGLGNNSAISLSTAAASVTGTLAVTTGTNLATSSGSVGIGLSSPTAKLEIQDGASGAAVKVSNSGGGSAQLAVSSNATSVATLSFTNSLAITGGNVGIGTSTAESNLHVAGTAAGSDVTLYIDNAAGSTLNNSSRLKFSSDTGSSVSSGGAELNCLVVDAGNGAVDLLVKTWTGGAYTEKARFLAGGGLTFNGDTAAANALDDYEEGTWTMGVSFGGASVGVTYANNTGTYTKIGRQVTVNGYLNLSSKGSSTGFARVTGLPFTIPNSGNNYSAPSLFFVNITFTNQFQANGVINSTDISLEETTSLGTNSGLTDADFGNNSAIILSFTYFV